MEDEFKNLRMTEISKGEAAAMRLALDERKRIQQEIQMRRATEEKDAAMAKSAHDEEEDFLLRCDKDDNYARELHDEEYALQVQLQEEHQASVLRKRGEIDSAADEKVGFTYAYLVL